MKRHRQAVARIRAAMKALMHSVDADFGKALSAGGDEFGKSIARATQCVNHFLN